MLGLELLPFNRYEITGLHRLFALIEKRPGPMVRLDWNALSFYCLSMLHITKFAVVTMLFAVVRSFTIFTAWHPSLPFP